MSAWLSEYLGQQVMQALLNGTNLTAPVSLYMAIATGPTSSDELSGGTYTRQSVTFGTITGTALSAPSSLTVAFVSIPGASITHFQLWDDPTAGNMLYSSTIDSSGVPITIGVSPGDTITFASGTFTVGFTGQP